MAENENKRVNYDLYSSVSKPYFSYKKPGEGSSAYCMLSPQIHSYNTTLRFTKSITSENRLDLNCYLSPMKFQDFVNILEGIMARRRDAYMSKSNYATDEAFKIPITRYNEGKDESIGSLTIDTELVDGIPRLRITYFENEKNDSVEIVFNDRIPTELASGTSKIDTIDYGDIKAFEFVMLMKELSDPSTSVVYGIVNSAVSTLTRYISACFSNNRNNTGNLRTGGFNRNYSNTTNPPQENYSDYEEPF